MQRRLLAVTSVCLLAITSVGCASVSGQQVRQDMLWHEARIEAAFQKALAAEDPHEQGLWEAEYERRVRAFESYTAVVQSEDSARAETLRQVGLAIQETALLILRERYP